MGIGHDQQMTWKTIRLDLARTAEYPSGSAAHAYVLRLPLGDDDRICAEALAHPDESPRVRRLWPNEPDKNGVVIPKGDGWAFSYEPGDEDDEYLFHLENRPIRVGEYLTITEADGEKLPFRVVRCHV
ncbi:MAG: hypothetical protein U5J78_02765 [Parasphingorhabdus sp.]|nr:hypothetical protein [Parasphingorhabdus sp.]